MMVKSIVFMSFLNLIYCNAQNRLNGLERNEGIYLKSLIGKKICTIVGYLFILFFYNNTFSQSMELLKKVKTTEGNINYYLPYKLIEKDTDIQIKYQIYSYLHFFKGIERPFFKKNKLADVKILFKTAKKEILNHAKSTRIVMFNEEHHNPSHRLYITTYLKELKSEGFTTLALESLSWKDSELSKRGYPIGISGSYIIEPYFANLVRKALELGFTVLPYENQSIKDREDREMGQATNLNDILNSEKGKILVLAGYDHIIEAPVPSNHENDFKWMAAILKEKFKVDPFTIDQTQVESIEKIKKVSIPYKNSKPYVETKSKDRYDVSLVYPKKVEYLHKELGKRKVKVKLDKKFFIENQLIQFYIEEEYVKYKEKAIPYEQFLIESTEIEVYLEPQRKYLLIIRNKDYGVLFEKVITNLKLISID